MHIFSPVCHYDLPTHILRLHFLFVLPCNAKLAPLPVCSGERCRKLPLNDVVYPPGLVEDDVYRLYIGTGCFSIIFIIDFDFASVMIHVVLNPAPTSTERLT